MAPDTGAQLIVREYPEFAGWAVARRLELPLLTQAIIHRLPPARNLRGPLADPDTLDADELATALTRLLEEPAYAHATQRLAAEINAMPDPERTADFLEQLAGDQPPAVLSAR